jgi:putative ABC transport system permease protein
MPALRLPGLRRVPLGWRLLSRDRVRFFVTVAGVGCAVLLMLFLAGVYGGVRTESNGYVTQRPVQVWLAHGNTTNLIRSSSFLSGSWTRPLEDTDGVASVAPLLRLITTLTVRDRVLTAFVCGIDPASAATRPTVVSGPGSLGSGEIIVDRALARRAGLAVGDSLRVQGRPYRVSGLSTGTNVVISQFTFINLDDAQDLLGFPGVVSFYLVRGLPGVAPEDLADRLKESAPDLNVFTTNEFIRNNLDEMRTGLLPILATVALFGGLVGTAVLTLLLYGSILERREVYALLKAIGANRGVLRTLVVRQALAVVLCGLLFGGLGYAAALPLVGRLVPVLAMSLSLSAAALITGASLLIGAVGACLPLAKLERIYPAEVFRA